MRSPLTGIRAGLVLAAAFVFSASALGASQERIIVAGGALTEIIFQLGKQDQIVAVDTTSLYPAATGALPKVGYFRQLSSEPILAMNPTLVIHETTAGPPEVLSQLAAAGVEMLAIPDDPTVEGAIVKVRLIAERLDVIAEGQALIDAMTADLAVLEAILANAEKQPRVVFALNFQGGAIFAAGRGTAADGIIRLAGGTNVAGNFVAYKQIGGEALTAAAPEFIVTAEHTLEASGGLEAIRAMPAVRATPAGARGNVIAIDALYMLGFGPRLPSAAMELAETLHGGVPKI